MDFDKKAVIKNLFFPITFLFTELFSHFVLFGWEVQGVLKISLFSLFLGALINFGASFLKEKCFTIFTTVICALIGFIHSVQLVYYSFFHSLFSWSTLYMALDLTQFWRETVVTIIKCLPLIIVVFLPLILFVIFRKRFEDISFFDKKYWIISGSGFLAVFMLFAFVPKENRDICIHIQNDASSAFKHFGVMFAGGTDAFYSIFGSVEEVVVNPYESVEVFLPEEDILVEEVTEPIKYNALDIDFDYLIKTGKKEKINEMHEYFKTVPPTKKNEYTGMFEGKNLIFLCLEGFSYKVIDENFTPILYKMYTDGFRFNNFYDSLWGGSTATGEYAVMTGNFYSKANCIKNSATTYQPYALGNLFKSKDYNTYAYHNHSYTYYGRDKSHPNFGYDLFKGVGNGLKLASNSWPNSDEELAVATIDEYIGSEKPFHAYYMTVSGHAEYNWGGNKMAKRNKDIIPPEWTYSEGVKAYYACQYEVEKMLGVLLNKLEEAGILKDTVFAMCCDHYPYALTDEELGELYDLDTKDIRSNFDLYRNAFILWSPSVEAPIEIDKPCSSYDIVPTIANLFGIEYDSRLITGKDILSDSENIVVLNILGNGSSWNWITEKGEYDAYKKVFTPNADMSVEEAESYKELTNQKVAAMRKYSFGILDNNYYEYVFDENGEIIKPLEESTEIETN